MKRFPPIPADIRQQVTERGMWMCSLPTCFERTTEIAHRIAKTWANVRFIRRFIAEEYGTDVDNNWVIFNIIHHPQNLCLSCRAHNDSFNIGNNPEAVKEFVRRILDSEIKKSA